MVWAPHKSALLLVLPLGPRLTALSRPTHSISWEGVAGSQPPKAPLPASLTSCGLDQPAELNCPPDFLLPASRSCNPSFPFLTSCSWARIPESPKAPGNARSGHTHSQHQLLEVPRQLSSDAGFDWFPSGLQILIKH